jgi:hypothetical protein
MAAPLGWKDFASGDVLTAADMDGYVMAQIVAVFADATARDASITSPQEGQHAWLKSDDGLYYVNAAGAWVASPVGDITGITTAANSGMAGGASSGTATISVDASNLTSVTGTTADYVVIQDVDDSDNTKRCLISDFVAAGDITGVTAGTALSGGGTSGTVTVNVDVNAAGSVTAVSGDYVLIEDIGDNTTKKALISDITALAGDITAVTAGTAMSGGGTTGAVTVNVDVNGAGSVTGTSLDYVLIEDVTDNTTKKCLASDLAADPIPLILALS